MKSLASVVGVLFVLIGLEGAIFPEALLSAGQQLATPTGLYIVAALRFAIGLLLILAASVSRMPKTLRVLGLILLLAGLFTPLVGVDRSRAMLNWFATHGLVYIRLLAGLGIAIGAFITFTVATRRRTA